MKPQHVSFCFQFVVPLLQMEMLDTFHQSLFKCLSHITLVVPGVACEVPLFVISYLPRRSYVLFAFSSAGLPKTRCFQSYSILHWICSP